MSHRDSGLELSPLRVFGAMLRSYRLKSGLSPEQLGARVYLSADMIGKIENGQRVPTEQLADACDAVPELNTGGELGELRWLLKDYLKQQEAAGSNPAIPTNMQVRVPTAGRQGCFQDRLRVSQTQRGLDPGA